jgi:hypothetical protein
VLVDQLVKAATSSTKFQPVALRCLVDICKAASRAPYKRDLPLRALAMDITHEIKVRLLLSIRTSSDRAFQSNLLKFPGQRPFWESMNPIDPAIYADALAMLWRFLPEAESMQIFEACLQPDKSHAVKLCAVAAMHTLARDVTSLCLSRNWLLIRYISHRLSSSPNSNRHTSCGRGSAFGFASCSW